MTSRLICEHERSIRKEKTYFFGLALVFVPSILCSVLAWSNIDDYKVRLMISSHEFYDSIHDD